MPRAIPNLRNNEDRGTSRKKVKGKRRFSSGSSLRGGEPKTPSHLEEEEISRNATLHSARPVRVRVENERSFYRGTRISTNKSRPLTDAGGDLTTASIVFLFFPRHVPRVSVCRFPPPFTQGWIRFRRMKSPGGLDFATHRSLHIYIYIRIVHSRILLSPQ